MVSVWTVVGVGVLALVLVGVAIVWLENLPWDASPVSPGMLFLAGTICAGMALGLAVSGSGKTFSTTQADAGVPDAGAVAEQPWAPACVCPEYLPCPAPTRWQVEMQVDLLREMDRRLREMERACRHGQAEVER